MVHLLAEMVKLLAEKEFFWPIRYIYHFGPKSQIGHFGPKKMGRNDYIPLLKRARLYTFKNIYFIISILFVAANILNI